MIIFRTFASRAILFGLCFGMATVAALATDPWEPLQEKDVDLQKVKSFFDAAFLKAEHFEDGSLVIENDGIVTFVNVEHERKIISFASGFPLKASASEIQKLKFINELNDGVVFVRFCMPKPTRLWCDYQMLYEGGITPYSIVNSYRYFVRVMKHAVSTRDEENLVGTD